MNPNGLVPLLRDEKVISFFGNQTPLSAIWRHSRAKTPVDRLTGTSCGSRKMDDWANQTLSNAHRGILMGLVRHHRKSAIRPPLMPVAKSATPVCPARCGTGKSKMVLRRRVGVGDIAIAPFIYNLFNVGLTGHRVQICNAGISNSLNAPQSQSGDDSR